MNRMVLVASSLFLVMFLAGFQENPEDTKGKEKKGQGWLGVSIKDLSSKIAKQKNLKSRDGAFIAEVLEDGPAESAGFEKGDVVAEFAGKAILDADELSEAVRKTSPGTKTNVVVLRKVERKTIAVTVGKMPSSHAFAFGFHRMKAPAIRMFRGGNVLGLQLRELNPQLGEYFGVPEGEGVLVEEVQAKSTGEKAGFKAGDVIVKLGKRSVNDIQDIWRGCESYKDEGKFDAEVLRRGTRKTLTIEIDESVEDFGGSAWYHTFPRIEGFRERRFEVPEIDITIPDEPMMRIEKELYDLHKLKRIQRFHNELPQVGHLKRI